VDRNGVLDSDNAEVQRDGTRHEYKLTDEVHSDLHYRGQLLYSVATATRPGEPDDVSTNPIKQAFAAVRGGGDADDRD
jgi:hypothetical protein